MPALLTTVERVLRFDERYARLLVEDLTDEQMVRSAGPGHENHPAFTLGHLVTAADMMAEDLGAGSDLPEGWGTLFCRRGPSDRRLPEPNATYPRKEELLRELTRQHDRVIAAMHRVDASTLAAPVRWRLSVDLPTQADVLVFMAASHAGMHLGQLAAWRRAMGLPAALARA